MGGTINRVSLFIVSLVFMLSFINTVFSFYTCEFEVTEYLTLWVKPINTTYTINAYVIPLSIENRQIVQINNIYVNGCKYKILKDELNNNYLQLICSKNKKFLNVKISYKVKRIYNVPNAKDLNIYTNQKNSICSLDGKYCKYEYDLGIQPIDEDSVVKNIEYYYQYLRANFKYNFSFSQSYTEPPIVLQKMEGTCDELAWLYIEILRNIGIPARYVLGIVFTGNYSGLHAWLQVWIDKGWYDIDLLNNQIYYIDGHHIYLGFFYRPEDVIECHGCNIINSKFIFNFNENYCTSKKIISLFLITKRINASYFKLNLTVNSLYPIYRNFQYSIYLDNKTILNSIIKIKPGVNNKIIVLPITDSYIGNHSITFVLVDRVTNNVYISKSYIKFSKLPKLTVVTGDIETKGKYNILKLIIKNEGQGIAKNVIIKLILSDDEKATFNFSDTEKTIEILKPNNETEIDFPFVMNIPILPAKSAWLVELESTSDDGIKQKELIKVIIINTPNPEESLKIALFGILLLLVLVWLIWRIKTTT